MNFETIVNLINERSDEFITNDQAINFSNQAISKINLDLRTQLPLVSGQSYDALKREGIETLLVPYVSYMIKKADDNYNSALMFSEEYVKNISLVQNNILNYVSADYLGTSTDAMFYKGRQSGRLY